MNNYFVKTDCLFFTACLLASTSLADGKNAWINQALERGLLHKHTQRSHVVSGLHETLGAGVCALDMDNDGWQDLFFAGGQGQTRDYGKDSWWNKKEGHRLYKNSGNGYFVDVSAQLKNLPVFDGMGCHAADLDGDNDTDLVITGFKESFILHNQKGQFTALPLPTQSVWTTSVAISDVNGDGLPDIYITGYLAYNYTAHVLETQSGFKTGELLAFKPASFKGERNFLFINKGKLQFAESAQALNALEPETRSLFTSVLNANNDAWPDLLITNDSGSQSTILLNQDGKRFVSANDILPIPKNALSMAVLPADTMPDNPPASAFWFNTQSGQLPVLLKKYRQQWQDRIYRSTDNLNILSNMNTFAAAPVDVNHDGEIDLALANGLAAPDEDSPARSRAQYNSILLGNKQGQYLQGITLPEVQSSRTVISVDIDNDGDRDLLFSNNNAMPELYMTPGKPQQWLGLAFDQSDIANLYGVTLETSERTFYRPIQANTFLGSHDARFTQSLQANETIKQVTVHRYHDDVLTLQKPALNNYINLQGKTVAASAIAPVTALAYPLARWLMMAKRLQSESALLSFQQWSTPEQLAFLEDVSEHDTSHDYLGIIVAASYSPNKTVTLKTVDILQQWEDELTANHLLHLLDHSDADVRCRTANAYGYFYQEEESMIESKRLAMPLLIKNAEQFDTCAIKALAYTRDSRPVFSLNPLLKKTTNTESLESILFALGELRHETSVPAITAALPQWPAPLQKAGDDAIKRIQGDIHDLTLSETTSDHCNLKDNVATLAQRCSENTLLALFKQQPALAKQFQQDALKLTMPPASKARILQALLGNNAATIIMSTLNNANATETDQLAALDILAFLPLPAAYTEHLQQWFTNTELSKPLRIGIGDVLIHSQADWLLNHKEGLF